MAPKEPQAPQSWSPQHATEVHEGMQHRVPEPVPAATAPAPTPSNELVLSYGVVSRGDVGKCLRELEELNNFFHQASIRGVRDQQLPAVNAALDDLAKTNGLNLLQPEDRQRLKDFLAQVKAKAPIVHLSLPSEASDTFIARILEWFRKSVHPHTILNVGLQPELAAGCVVRTTNRQFDFSFRKRFEKSKQKLLTAIEALDTMPEKTKLADANATNQPTALSGSASVTANNTQQVPAPQPVPEVPANAASATTSAAIPESESPGGNAL